MKVVLVAGLILVLAACTANEATPTPPPTAIPTVAPTLPPPATATPDTTAAATSTPAFPSPRPAPTDPALTPLLQAVLDEWRDQSGTPGAVVGVRLADGRTAIVASGFADQNGSEPVEPTDRFRIGSITKTFVAALILGLAADGLIELDALVVEYLPDAPHADEVTVLQLLAHTSGIADFGAEPDYQGAIFASPGRVWGPAEVLGLIDYRPLAFDPGTAWAYSNTNYSILGLIAEAVTGEPLADLLRTRVADRLGLTDTYLEALEAAPPVPVSGHHDFDGDGRPDSVAGIPYTALVSSGAAAGGLSATALDVLDFASGLFGGRLLDEPSLERMLEPVPVAPTYGLGIARFDAGGTQAWGHPGALPGFSTLFAHSPDEGVTVVGLANRSGADVGELAERTVAELLSAGLD